MVAMIRLPTAGPGEMLDIRGVWRSVRAPLRRLLVSDILIRTCEGLVDVFIVLYVTTILGVPTWRYGILVGIQMATSIAAYLPAAWLAHRVGRKPFVIATFTSFALFPVAIVAASGFSLLVVAFVLGGLREIGEPSRKAMIVDSAEAALRARTVGLYYLVRSVAIAPASMIGGVLWSITPITPFLVAGAIGILGTIVFALTVHEHIA
jgi:MFS family permease